MTTILAISSNLGAALLWVALVGIALLAAVLYFPRGFSGPLTEHERRAAHASLRWRSLAMALATPIATLVGLALLLPPPVALVVPSQVMRGEPPELETEGSVLAHISLHRSTATWTCDVIRRALALHRTPGEEELRAAILDAARHGFSGTCDMGAEGDRIDAWQVLSVELSLVELAARAFMLTAVAIDAGPPLADPDPWELMRSTLEARGITTYLRRPEASSQAAAILRLGQAKRMGQSGKFEVLAVVQGPICGSPLGGRLVGTSQGRGSVSVECTLEATAESCSSLDVSTQRVMTMDVSCDPIDVAVPTWVLSAGYGETLVLSESAGAISATGDETFVRALAITAANGAFADEVQRRGLSTLRADPPTGPDGLQVDIRSNDQTIVVRGASADFAQNNLDVSAHLILNVGPFSWHGFPHQPLVQCEGSAVTIHLPGDILDPEASATYDPSAFMATMYTITWAANALRAGTCEELREPRPFIETRVRPLLSASEIDSAVLAINRDREVLGLLLLALAMLLLALGLRRSVR